MNNTQTSITWSTVVGFAMTVAVMVIEFLTPVTLSADLSKLLVGIIVFAGLTFHIAVSTTQSNTIATLKGNFAQLQNAYLGLQSSLSKRSAPTPQPVENQAETTPQ